MRRVRRAVEDAFGDDRSSNHLSGRVTRFCYGAAVVAIFQVPLPAHRIWWLHLVVHFEELHAYTAQLVT